jgi:non-homologous end joining protein Ku
MTNRCFVVIFIDTWRTYYEREVLSLDEGGEKPYKTARGRIGEDGKISCGRTRKSGKEQLVVIRLYRGGLVLHGLYYEIANKRL